MLAAPLNITIDLTTRCNLRCGYCCFFSSEAECGCAEMPTERILALIREMGQAKVMTVGIRGGEALIRSDFRRIVEEIVACRMRFSLLTNGILLDREMCRFLHDTGRCDFVKISLDGTEEMHDAVRGKGSHRQALRAIREASETGLKVITTMAVHKLNAPHLTEGAGYIFSAVPAGVTLTFSGVTTCEASDRYAMDDHEFRLAQRDVIRFVLEHRKFCGAAGMYALALRWKSFLHKAEINAPDAVDANCTASAQTLYVRADGAKMPCPNMAEIAGNPDDGILDYWINSPDLKLMRQKRERPDYPECPDCPYNRYCTGGCYVMKYHTPERRYHCLRLFEREVGLEELRKL